jgi:hypothetical protein
MHKLRVAAVVAILLALGITLGGVPARSQDNPNSQPLIIEVLPNTGPAGAVVQVNVQGIGEGITITEILFGDVAVQLPAPVMCGPDIDGCTMEVTVPDRLPGTDLTVCVRAVTLDTISECTTFTFIE